MNKADKFKLLYIFSISLIFYFIGCVDTSVQNMPTSIDYHSQIQILNLASVDGAVSTINIVNADGKMDGTTGQLNVGDAYPPDGQAFMDIPSGTKTFNVIFASGATNSFKLTIDTERKIRLLLINPDLSTNNLVKSDERYTWQEKNSEHAGDLFPSDTASISFYNATPDVSVDSVVLSGAGAPINLGTSLGIGKSIGYMFFSPPANYTITFKRDTTGFAADTTGLLPGEPTLATATINAQSKGKYSAILYGTQGNLQAKVYTDD